MIHDTNREGMQGLEPRIGRVGNRIDLSSGLCTGEDSEDVVEDLERASVQSCIAVSMRAVSHAIMGQWWNPHVEMLRA